MVAPHGSFRYAYAVGYLNKDLQDNFLAVAPCFVSIGAEGYNLSQLKVEGVDPANEPYVEIQMLDDMGVVGKTYEWWHGGKGAHKTDGWYEDGSDLVDGDDYEVQLTKGQGLWVRAVSGAKIVSSGEVCSENVTILLDPNFTMVANPFPCTLGLSKVDVTDVEEANASCVEIQMLDDMGVAGKTFEWWHGGKGAHKTDGWYEDGSDLVDGDEYEYDLFPGQALWIRTDDGATITFNCPFNLSAE